VPRCHPLRSTAAIRRGARAEACRASRQASGRRRSAGRRAFSASSGSARATPSAPHRALQTGIERRKHVSPHSMKPDTAPRAVSTSIRRTVGMTPATYARGERVSASPTSPYRHPGRLLVAATERVSAALRSRHRRSARSRVDRPSSRGEVVGTRGGKLQGWVRQFCVSRWS